MTVIKARNLGRFYFFLVAFVLFIPVSAGLAYTFVIAEVADSYVTVDSDGESTTHYKLETVTDEEWVMLRQEQKNFVDIISGVSLACGIYYGASFGEDVIINNQKASHTWDDRSVKMFSRSYFIAHLIWHSSFMFRMYGSDLYNAPIKIVSVVVLAGMIAAGGAGNIAVHAGERIIHKLLTFHK